MPSLQRGLSGNYPDWGVGLRSATLESLASEFCRHPVAKGKDSSIWGKFTAEASMHSRSLSDLRSTRWPRLGKIVESPAFGICSGLLIVLNAVMIGIDTDIPLDEGGPAVRHFNEAQEYFFVAAFTLELVLKLVVYGRQFFAPSSDIGWNILDVVLIGISFVETFILKHLSNSRGVPVTFLRLLRIMRLVRLVKLIKIFKPLYLLAAGLMQSIQVLFWGLVLMVLIIYMSAIALRHRFMTFAEGDEEYRQALQYYWGSLGGSMFSLFQAVTGDGWASAIARPMIDRDPKMVIFFLAFVFITQFAVLNVMVAVIVESVIDTAFEVSDTERQDKEETHLRNAVFEMYLCYADMDTNNDGVLTKEEFLGGLESPGVKLRLTKAGVSAEDTEELFDLYDYDQDGTITLMEFIAGTMQCRGLAKAKDMLLMNCEVHRMMAKIKDIGKAVLSLSQFIGMTDSPLSRDISAALTDKTQNDQPQASAKDAKSIQRQLKNIESSLREGIDPAFEKADVQAMLMQLKSIEEVLHERLDFADDTEAQTMIVGRTSSHSETETSSQVCMPSQITVANLEDVEAHLVHMLDAFLPESAAAGAAAMACLTTVRTALGRPSAGATSHVDALIENGNVHAQITAAALEEAHAKFSRMRDVFLRESAAAEACLQNVQAALPGCYPLPTKNILPKFKVML